MRPGLCRARWKLSGTREVEMATLMSGQVAVCKENARVILCIMIGHLQSTSVGAPHGGHVTSRSETSEGTK